MKKTYFLVLFTLTTLTFSQVKKDSTIVVKDSVKQVQQDVLYTSKDIALIDSLVLENQLQSIFMDEIREYYISNTDTADVSEVALDAALLKERLAKINETTPFHLIPVQFHLDLYQTSGILLDLYICFLTYQIYS